MQYVHVACCMSHVACRCLQVSLLYPTLVHRLIIVDIAPYAYRYMSHTAMPDAVTTSGFSTVYDIVRACAAIDVHAITERAQVEKALSKVSESVCVCAWCVY